ncbi:MAG: enoyl-CoA hydratase/isomerase family protein [Chloroflexota bacterium]|nr:enoyl-CoA hydratase/isomerase family protein [Chloroflexota bacterium]
MTVFSTLLYEVGDAVATLTLNRPNVLNALNCEMRAELMSAFDRAAADEGVRAVLLTGSGRGFCAGQDLGERRDDFLAGRVPPLGPTLEDEYNPLVRAMRGMPKPIVAAVNGVAAGAGCSLALACDLRICADTASFLQAFVNIGLVPDSGSSFLLPRLVGMARAAEMMFLGQAVDASEAARIGLVNSVVPADQLPASSRALAVRLAQLPTKAIGQMKRQLNLALEGGLDAVLAEEAAGQDMAGRTADHLEGVTAFLQKRQPRFVGH